MDSTWLLVANSSSARIFACSQQHRLQELTALTHPASRLRDADLGSDEPGQTSDRSGHGFHGMTPPTSLHDKEVEVFAREVVDRMKQEYEQHSFEHLLIIAAPRFLGLLRDRLPENLRRSVLLEIDKDVSHMPASEIEQQLPEFF